MPLPPPSVLGQQIAASMLAKVQAQFPAATAQPSQQDVGKAVAAGIVSAMQSLAVGFGGVGPPEAGPGVGISGVSASNMASGAANYLSSQTGSSGAAAPMVFNGMFEPIVQALAQATVLSVSGFGGQALKIVGLEPSPVAQLIMAQMPASFQSSSQGMNFVMAVATGFCTEMLANGLPGVVPAGGIPPGPVVVKFS